MAGEVDKWKDADGVAGIGAGRSLRIIGAVLLPVRFGGLRDMHVTLVMRFKIFAKGTCGWTGLVIGGPSLEASPLGLGLKPCSGGALPADPGTDGTQDGRTGSLGPTG